MKTAQVNGNKIVIKEAEDLKLNNRKGAIVKILGCGLCGSDIVKFKHGIAKDGTVLGHEIVAVIEEINSETDFKIGDKIVSSHHIPCFECTYCKHENYSMCAHFKKTNILYVSMAIFAPSLKFPTFLAGVLSATLRNKDPKKPAPKIAP